MPRGTTHQALNATVGTGSLLALSTPVAPDIALAFVAGMVVAARLPDQLEFRQTLNAVRRVLRPFKPRPVRGHPERLTRPSWRRRAWDRWVLPHGPSEAFVARLFIPHRQVTHWLTTGALVGLVVWLAASAVREVQDVAAWIGLGTLAGCWWHSIMDGFTEKPVQLVPGRWTHLAPRRLRFHACGAVDTTLAVVGTVATVVFAMALAERSARAAELVGRVL